MTLEYALSLADEPHPDLEVARAELDAARAGRLGAAASTDLGISLDIEPRWGRPYASSEYDDHELHLRLRKRLYDFGRSASQVAAAEAEVKGYEWLVLDARQRRRLEIMRRFFDVLLADLAFTRDNEDMAVAYVRLDALRDRNRLGQVSDVELLEAESRYQEIRRRRYASEALRRTTRALLAQALNRPGMLPDELAEPALPGNERPLPEVEGLIAEAMEGNPALQALQARIEAARERVRAARAERMPLLDGEARASTYARQFAFRNRYTLEFFLEVPLYVGDRVRAEVAARQAELRRLEAERRRREMAVRQAVLETWQEIGVLRAQRDEARTLTEFRDLYLDRSRALYELEVKTDLGDAMVRFSEARLRRAETEYALALAWARLDALTGRQVSISGARSASPVRKGKIRP